jgi:hypothetical protein
MAYVLNKTKTRRESYENNCVMKERYLSLGTFLLDEIIINSLT